MSDACDSGAGRSVRNHGAGRGGSATERRSGGSIGPGPLPAFAAAGPGGGDAGCNREVRRRNRRNDAGKRDVQNITFLGSGINSGWTQVVEWALDSKLAE